jgi:ABC-type multidrug transport system ATPase subunit
MAPALSIADVSRSYGRRRVLDQVSFTVQAGSIFGVLGANGAGKTTLFSIVAGYILPDAGHVEVHGRPIAQALGMVGVLPQDARFQGDLSILDQLSWLLRFMGRSRDAARAEVAQMLAKVGLGDYLGQRAVELSHGMYKRLALAQAFLGDPALVLLDEPTAGLDPANARTIRALIREVRNQDAAVVVSSHDLAEMQELCDGVVILEKGVVRATGSVADLCRRQRVLRFDLSRPLTDAERAIVGSLAGVNTVVTLPDGLLQVALADDAGAGALAVQGCLTGLAILVRRCEMGDSLEQVFLSLTDSRVADGTPPNRGGPGR